jgi:hypothetical protein
MNAPLSNGRIKSYFGSACQKELEMWLFGAGGGIRARDLWTMGVWHPYSPDYESGFK